MFYVFFKLVWFLLVVCVWLVVATVVLPIALIIALTGNRSAARDSMRVLDWGRMF
jgi:hypothetical protein